MLKVSKSLSHESISLRNDKNDYVSREYLSVQVYFGSSSVINSMVSLYCLPWHLYCNLSISHSIFAMQCIYKFNIHWYLTPTCHHFTEISSIDYLQQQ